MIMVSKTDTYIHCLVVFLIRFAHTVYIKRNSLFYKYTFCIGCSVMYFIYVYKFSWLFDGLKELSYGLKNFRLGFVEIISVLLTITLVCKIIYFDL